MSIRLKETHVNMTTETRYSETSDIEPFTDDIGALYKALVREYGRCSGHVYIDRTGGAPIPIGWVFVKRVAYDDARRIRDPQKRSYLREVWVELYDQWSDTPAAAFNKKWSRRPFDVVKRKVMVGAA